jgi:hypothetical protein
MWCAFSVLAFEIPWAMKHRVPTGLISGSETNAGMGIMRTLLHGEVSVPFGNGDTDNVGVESIDVSLKRMVSPNSTGTKTLRS